MRRQRDATGVRSRRITSMLNPQRAGRWPRHLGRQARFDEATAHDHGLAKVHEFAAGPQRLGVVLIYLLQILNRPRVAVHPAAKTLPGSRSPFEARRRDRVVDHPAATCPHRPGEATDANSPHSMSLRVAPPAAADCAF